MIKRILIAITVPVFLVLGLITALGGNTPAKENNSAASLKKASSFRLPDTTSILPKNLADEAIEYLSPCLNTGSYTVKDCMEFQDEFVREYINAYSGDYLAISNVSTMFSQPLAGAVRVNDVQGCAWRLVLMRSGSPYLSNLDKDVTKEVCAAAGGLRDQAAVSRANEITVTVRSHRIHPVAVPQIHYDPKRDRDEQTADE